MKLKNLFKNVVEKEKYIIKLRNLIENTDFIRAFKTEMFISPLLFLFLLASSYAKSFSFSR